MNGLSWVRGLIRHRPARMLATAVGVAVAVALIAAIGTFLSATTSRMTARAIARVPVDWQVEAQPGTSGSSVLAQVRRALGVQQALPVSFTTSPGLSATLSGSTQTTGAAQVVGLPPGYRATFPGELRPLTGTLDGPVLAQQTASNLHAAPGSTVTVSLPGGGHTAVRIAGVADLPAADSLFQRVGAPTTAQPTAPPDNVLLLPAATFRQVEARTLATHPELIRTQVHVRLSHRLPASPSAAFDVITARAHNLESRLTGTGLVGDNLGTALDSARSDALYAQILFLFLGVPGAVIAGLLTALIASTGAQRRRRDAALLRTRGASTGTLVRLALTETAVAAALGVTIGLVAAAVIGRGAFGTGSFGASGLSAVLWAVGAGLAGVLIAAAAIAIPAVRDARALTVAGQRRQVGREQRAPLWARWGLDLLALVLAGIVFWQASRNGYQLVLAPEGVAQVSVNWYALLAPVLGWIGLGLLAYRLADLGLGHGRRWLARGLRPLAGRLSGTVAATMGRQRRLLASAVALLALTAAFAGSTSVFNSTYRAQAEVDARLTNGADVTVTESPGAVVTPAQGQAQFGHLPGVASVEPLQHRYAYIGADLQDLFGVRPGLIGRQGKLQDAWFAGGSASQLMRRLARAPDSILVSQETVHDYQLHPGDRINLRLQDGRSHRLITVPFHYVGVAKEFLTAPKDSFFIANQAYVAARTGSAAVGAFLIQADGTSPAVVARRVAARTGSGPRVTNIVDQRQITGSNLTAVELSGLTRIELGFALVLAVAASGLALALGFQERRRTFAIAAALGARSRQLGGFIWSESVLVTVGGLTFGAAIAALLSVCLVDVLTGVFDPPPDTLSIPWRYLLGVALCVSAAVAVAGAMTLRSLRRPSVEQLRDL
ncbi:MAG TPA: ABC transporter permease [Solirubrobacteraceae bacterium]|nr:ABC transporter permease [Solirubrobacteraceae bacterium]